MSGEENEDDDDDWCLLCRKSGLVDGYGTSWQEKRHEVPGITFKRLRGLIGYIKVVSSICTSIKTVKIFSGRVTLHMVSVLVPHLAKVTKLDLSGCELTTEGLVKIVESFPNLQTLDITGCGCRGITSKILDLFANLQLLWDESLRDSDVCERCQTEKSSLWSRNRCKHSGEMGIWSELDKDC